MKIHWLEHVWTRLQVSKRTGRNRGARSRRHRTEQRFNPPSALCELLEPRVLLSGTAVANQTPTNILLSAATVAENKPTGTTVGTLSTTDPDAGTTFTYTLVSGSGSTDNARFAIVGGTLTTASVFNFEAQNSASIRIRSTDQGGLWTEKTFTISITNVNESPTDISLSAASVGEYLPSGTVVGTLSTTDPDAANTFTYSLVSGTGSTDNASFSLAGNTLKTAASFNADAKNSYSVRIRTTDQGGLTFEEPFTISVTNSPAVSLIDAGGLEFRSATLLTRSGTTGSVYSTSGVTYVGFVPASGSSFVKLLELDGSVTVDTSAVTFSASGAIKDALVSPAITLIAGGLSSTHISDVLSGKLTSVIGSTITAASRNFTLNSLSLNATGDNGNPAILLQGSVALPGGLNLAVNGTNHVSISSQGIRLTGVSASLSSTFTLGSLTLDATKLTAGYSNSSGNNAFTVTGTSSATVPGLGTLSLKLGDSSVGSTGLVVTDNSLAFDASASTTGLTMAGATLSATGLRFTYGSATTGTNGHPEQFSLSGTANLNYGTGNNLTLTMPTSSGLVIRNNALSSLNATATFATGTKIAGVSFSNTSLTVDYATTPAQLSLYGSTTMTFASNQSLALTLGDSTTPGMLISGGALQAFNGSVVANSPVALGGTNFTLNRASVGYTAATSATAAVLTVSGAGSISAATGVNGGNSFSVQLGSPATSTTPATKGLVISNGTIQSLDMVVKSDLTVAGLKFKTNGLRITENTTASTLTLTGNTSFSDSELGTVSVNFGGTTASSTSAKGVTNPSVTTAGLVIKNNALTSLDMTVTSSITVGGVSFATSGMRFTDVASTGVFTMTGGASFTESNLGTVNVNFGDSNSKGLVETNGVLTSLDMTVNSNLSLAGVTMTAKGLHMVYTAGTNSSPDTFTATGTSSATVPGLGTLNLTLGDSSVGSAGLVVTDNSFALDALASTSGLTMAGATLSAPSGLHFTYVSAMNSHPEQFTLSGTANLNYGTGNNLTLTMPGTSGLVITNNALSSLDATATFATGTKIAGVSFSNTSLTVDYAAAAAGMPAQLSLYGSTTMTFASNQSLALTLGDSTTPGMLISGGTLQAFNGDVIANSSVALGGTNFTLDSASVEYTAATSATASVLTISGAGSITSATGVNGGNSFSVQLGSPATSTTPATSGLVISNGTIKSLDMAVTTDLTVAGFTFRTNGLRITENTTTKTLTMTGNTSFSDSKLGTVSVNFGGTTTSSTTATGTVKPSVITSGLVIKNNALVSLDMTVTSNITLGGVRFATSGMRFTDVASTGVFTMTGGASFTESTLGTVNVNFGDSNSKGLVETNGVLTSLDMTVNSNLTVASVTMTATGLHMVYTAGTNSAPDTFSLTGKTSVSSSDGRLSLAATFGSTGLVITGGHLTSLDMTVNSTFSAGSVTFTTKNLDFVFTSADHKFSLTGTASVQLPSMDSSASVTFGGNGDPGLVVQNGRLIDFDIALTSNFRSGGVQFTTRNLTITYASAGSLFTLSGTAAVTMPSLGSVAVTLGQVASDGTVLSQGLVIQNGSFVSMDMTINADVRAGGVLIHANNLEFAYSAVTKTFTMSGETTVDMPSMGTVSVRLGTYSGAHATGTLVTPGLVVTNGKFVSMDLTVNSDFKIGSIQVYTENLNFDYVDSTKTFTMSGIAGVQMPTLGRVEVTMGTYSGEKATGTLLKPGLVVTNNKFVSMDMTVNTDIHVGSVRLFTHNLNFDYVAATDTFTMTGTAGMALSSYGAIAVTLGQQDSLGHTLSTGLVIQHGNLVSLDMTVNSVFNVDGAIFTARNLNFTYVSATDTFTMQGTASVVIIGALSSLEVTLGQVANDGTVLVPGLVIVGGQFQSIDMTVNSAFHVDVVTFTTRNLHLHYSEIAANGYPARTFTMTGTASVAVPLLASVDVTFGGSGTQGLVVTNNVLEYLNMTVDASVLGFGGYSLASANLIFNYTAVSHLFTMSGTAEIGLPELGGIKVTLGGNGTQGLVINTQNNVVVSFDMSASADFSIAGVKFGQAQLKLSYTDANHEFIASGSASLNLKLETFTAQLGGNINGHQSTGLDIRNGKLISLDFIVTGQLGLPSLSLGSASLYVAYDGATHTFDFEGSADATLSAKLPSWVTTYFGLPSGSFHVGTVNIDVHVESGGTQAPPEQTAGSDSSNVSGAVDPNFDLPWTYGIDTGVTPNTGDGGTQVKYIANTGSLSNTSSAYLDGTSYQITFAAAQQSGNVGKQSFEVTVDGVSVGVFTPPTTNFEGFSTSVFTPGHGSHTIAFNGLGNGVTAYLDHVSVNQAATPAALSTPLTNPTPDATALSFNGTSQYVQLPNHGFADFSTGFSAGMWVYPTAVNNWERLFDFANGAGQDNILLARNGTSNDLSFVVYQGSTASGVTAANAIQLNTWQYFSVVMQAPAIGATTTQATLYKNGAPIATGTVNVPNTVNRALNYVGKSNWSTDSLFAGQMNDFSLWNRALTPTQMQVAPGSVFTGTEAGLVGYWPMNDTSKGVVFDRGPSSLLGSNSGLNGTTTASTVTISTGTTLPNVPTIPAISSALTFDGTSGYVSLPATGLSNFTSGFSAGVWVYPTAASNNARIFDFGNGTASDNIVLTRNGTSSDLSLQVFRGSSQSTLVAAKAIQLNVWQYFSVVVQPSASGATTTTATLYKNGVPIANGTVNAPSNVNRTLNYIGKSNWSANSLFAGQMAGLGVWSTPLTQAQVQAGMNSGETGSETGLVGYWPLSGPSTAPTSTIVTDSSFTNAATFDGISNSYNVTSNSTDFSQGFSAGVWVYPTNTNSDEMFFDVLTGGAGNNFRLARSGTSNDLTFTVSNQPAGVDIAGTVRASNAIELNKWQYFSVVVQPTGGVTLFKNGQQIQTGLAFLLPNTVAPQLLVANGDGLGQPFAGQLAGLSIWNIPLTVSQVETAANTTLIGTETGLVNYLAMGFDPTAPTPLSPNAAQVYSTSTAQTFDGTTQSLQVPGTGLTDFSNGFSAGVWVYPTAANSGAPLFEFGNGAQTFYPAGSQGIIQFYDDILLARNGTSNDLTFSVLSGTSNPSVTASNAITLNQWQYFSVVMQPDGSTTLYKNGVAIKSGQVAIPAQIDRTSNTVGKTNSNGIAKFFAGEMMGLSIWNTPLSQQQVKDGMTTTYTGNESGLVAYWPMDGSPAANVSDLGTNQLNGIAEGGLSYTPLSSGYHTPFAGSLTFDGATTSVQLPATGFSNFSTGLSAGVWVYPTADSDNARLFDLGNGTANDNIVLTRDGTSNDLSLQVFRGSTQSTLVASNALQLNAWQYFSVVIQPAASGATTTTATIYKNGAAIATGTVSAPNNVNRTRNYIGKSNWSANSLFTGQMNSFSLWNTALTAAQVKAGMTSTYSGTVTGLIGYWPMNESAGSAVIDHSTNRRNGVVTGEITSQTTNTSPRSANLDFETPQLADGQFVVNPANAGWTFANETSTDKAGITANDSSIITASPNGVTTAINGSQAAFLQGNSSMSTTLTGFASSQCYTLSFYAAQSKTNGEGQYLQVYLDGNLLGTGNFGVPGVYLPPDVPSSFSNLANAYTQFTIPVGIIGPGTHTLTFSGKNPVDATRSGTVLIDGVAFTDSVPTAITPAILNPPPTFADASFEQNHSYTGPWTFNGSAGTTQHGSQADQNGSGPPDGSWEAYFKQDGGSSLTQTIDGFASGQYYDLSFFTKGGSGFNAGQNSFIVTMDGTTLGTYHNSTDQQWEQIFVRGISPGPGDHTFTFTSTGLSNAPVTLIDQVQFFNSGNDTVSAVNAQASPSNGSHSSYAAFTINVDGIDVGIQVFFDGKVNLIYGDVLGQDFQRMAQDLTKAYKATAQALSDAAKTVAGTATSVANLVADDFEASENAIAAAANNAGKAIRNGLKKVGRALKHLFNYYVDGATVYYDPSNSLVTAGETTGDSAKTDASGGFQLELPTGNLTGQLVGYGGIDTATGLPNDATFTAVPTSQVLSPLTTLVNTLVVTRGISEQEAIATIDAGLGLSSPANPDGTGGPYNVDLLGTMDHALAGDPNAALAFAGEVKVYLLAHETAALLLGLQDNTSSNTTLMSYAFRALANALQNNFLNQGSLLDLSDPNVINGLIQSTASAAGLTLDPSLSQPGAVLIARLENAMTQLSNQAATAPGTLSFLQWTAAYQTLADGTIAPLLTQAVSDDPNPADGLNRLLATYTPAQIDADAASTTIGNLTPPVVSIDPNADVHDSTGAGQVNYLEFQVSVSGTASPLLPIRVSYTTVDGTATAQSGDYTPVSGTLVWDTIDPVTHMIDTSPKTIRVPIAPGTSLASAKQFFLQLVNEQNAVVTYSTGVGTIDKSVFETTTTLQALLQPDSSNGIAILKAMVTDQDSVNSAAVGSVTFFDGTTALGTTTLDASGTAILGVVLASGSHAITARYNGRVVVGGVYNPSASAVLTETISDASSLTSPSEDLSVDTDDDTTDDSANDSVE